MGCGLGLKERGEEANKHSFLTFSDEISVLRTYTTFLCASKHPVDFPPPRVLYLYLSKFLINPCAL